MNLAMKSSTAARSWRNPSSLHTAEGLRFELFSTAEALPEADWRAVLEPGQTFLQPEYLRALERSRPERMTFFYALFREAGRPVAVASFQCVDFGLDGFGPNLLPEGASEEEEQRKDWAPVAQTQWGWGGHQEGRTSFRRTAPVRGPWIRLALVLGALLAQSHSACWGGARAGASGGGSAGRRRWRRMRRRTAPSVSQASTRRLPAYLGQQKTSTLKVRLRRPAQSSPGAR